MDSIKLTISKSEIATVISIGFYWSWVLTIFYNASFRPTEFSYNATSLVNIGSHIIALIGGVILFSRITSMSKKRAYIIGAIAVAAMGTLSLFESATFYSPVWQIIGSIASGVGSAALLVCWGDMIGYIESDFRRRNVLSISILIAVAFYIVVSLLPSLLQVILAIVMITISGVAALRAFDEAPSSRKPEKSLALSPKTRNNVSMKWWSLLLCTFLFSIPLVYFRAGESAGIQLSVFTAMLCCLCIIFPVDYFLRRRFNYSFMPHLFVLLTSGGMILLPFFVQGDVFTVGVLIHTGAFAFRAFVYPEFVTTAKYMGRSSAFCCAFGTVAIDLGQIAGTIMRDTLAIQSDQWFTHTTLGVAYILFLAAFLFFTHRFDVERDEKQKRSSKANPVDAAPSAPLKSTEPKDDSAQQPMITGIEKQCDLMAERYGLSARETDVLKLLVRGRSGASIADELVLSLNTVKTHISHIYQKCGAHSREELVILIENEGH